MLKFTVKIRYEYCNHDDQDDLDLTIRYGTVRYHTVRYGTVRYRTVPYAAQKDENTFCLFSSVCDSIQAQLKTRISMQIQAKFFMGECHGCSSKQIINASNLMSGLSCKHN